jgi:hypothetical protein
MNSQVRQLLENSEYSKHLYDIDGVYIYLDPSWSKVLVNLSGGADSAMLIYLISKIITDNNLNIEVHVISHVRMWATRPWNKHTSLQVLSHVKSLFPNIKYTRHEHFIPPDLEYGAIGHSIKDKYGRLKSGDNIIARSFTEYIVAMNDIDAAYSGVTMNPPGLVTNDIVVERNSESLDPTDIRELLIYVDIGKGATSISPFKFTAKDWIIKQYVNNQQLDLLALTRSCEGPIDGLTYRNYTPGQYLTVCGECFWCIERQWALKENQL